MLLPNAHHLGLSMYIVLLDSNKYLLSYSTFINPLEPDVHHMTSQILSILIDFYPDLCATFQSFIQSLNLYNSGTRKDIKKIKKRLTAVFLTFKGLSDRKIKNSHDLHFEVIMEIHNLQYYPK